MTLTPRSYLAKHEGHWLPDQDHTAPDLISAVKSCAVGQTTVGPTALTRLLSCYVKKPTTAPQPGFEQLTNRETEVLLAMSRRVSNAEISLDLWMAETTVKTHVARILAKLQVRDRVQAIVLAHRHGMLSD